MLLVLPTVASAAWQPPKTVEVIIGFNPGSGNEVAFRKAASIVNLTNPDITFVVRNMAGADSSTATTHFLKEKSDGSFLLVPSHMGTFVTNDVWQKNVKTWKNTDLVPIVTLGKSPQVLVASVKSKVNTADQFVEYIKDPKNSVFIAIGAGAHRAAYEFIVQKTGVDRERVKHINFNGPAQAVDSVSKFDGKEGTEFGIMPLTIAQPLIDAGLVKPLGLTGDKPLDGVNIPVLSKQFPGMNVYAAWAIALSKDAPKEVIDWYQKEFSKAVTSQEYRDWAKKNMIFIEESELEPVGVRKNLDNLRSTFIPILEKLDVK